ncbi:cytochrome P450 [Polychytrium aggregatum]|uniref:cytochrome P450 n=1 Tax=Polychytrium aggregatum TaxID=110093 RepID=UPI0022FDC9E1|nr:cytochrome P450 [Polychytrium aggregatum]KAI9209237.1 cytochrome P450 [Polychytrium aggregatum]
MSASPVYVAIINNNLPSQSILIDVGSEGVAPPTFPHQAQAQAQTQGEKPALGYSGARIFHDLTSLLQCIETEFGIANPRLTPYPVDPSLLLKSALDNQADRVSDLKASNLWFASGSPGRHQLPLPPGNVLDLLPAPALAMIDLNHKYGHFFPVSLGPRPAVVVSDPYLIEEIMKQEDCFGKFTNAGPLHYLKPVTGNGLFTANDDDPVWGMAHRILLPAFSVKSLGSAVPLMNQQTKLLVEAFRTRFLEKDETFDISEWMSKVTLDIVSLFGFSYELNSISSAEQHPFVKHMVFLFEYAMTKNKLGPLSGIADGIDWFTGGNKEQKVQEAVTFIMSTVNEVIKEHQADPDKYSDMCSRMLKTEDPETGLKLSEENIAFQIVTFMIAGHETTSSLLAWTIYMIATHPEVEQKLRYEIETVFAKGNGNIDEKSVGELKYTLAVLKETLRVYSSAPLFTKQCTRDTFVGPYLIKKDTSILFHTINTHRNQAVWGANPEVFNPDNFLPQNESKRPQYSYIAFGTGPRACIGSQFALIEARIVIAHLLHNFKFTISDDAEPVLQVKLALLTLDLDTAKPASSNRSFVIQSEADRLDVGEVLVLFGTNMGTSEDVARNIADSAVKLGFKPTVASLDTYANEKLFGFKFVIVATSTYNGNPPDNAKKFAKWISAQGQSSLKDTIFAIYGVGNKQWKTYQDFPRFVETSLVNLGATPLLERGAGDVDGDFDTDTLKWTSLFWASVAYTFKISGSDASNVVDPSPASNSIEVTWAGKATDAFLQNFQNSDNNISSHLGRFRYIVKSKTLLTKPGAVKDAWSIVLEIPASETNKYTAGDHFEVYPRNTEEDIVKLSNTNSIAKRELQIFDTEIPLRYVFNGVDIRTAPTRNFLKFLSGCTECPPEKNALLLLAGTDEASLRAYTEQIAKTKASIADVIERFKSLRIPLGQFLENVPLQKPRLYSIASSNLITPTTVELCIGVLNEEHHDLKGQSVVYKGLSSNFLAGLEVGGPLLGHIRPHGSAFKLPEDPKAPIVLVCAGTGFAPMRSFLEERKGLKQKGVELGEATLIFGCRHPDQDALYSSELQAHLESGVLTRLEYAFSRFGGQKEYVQTLIVNKTDLAEQLWTGISSRGAHILLCGSTALGTAVRESFVKIVERFDGRGKERAEQYIAALAEAGRYVVDVWG